VFAASGVDVLGPTHPVKRAAKKTTPTPTLPRKRGREKEEPKMRLVKVSSEMLNS